MRFYSIDLDDWVYISGIFTLLYKNNYNVQYHNDVTGDSYKYYVNARGRTKL